MSRRLGAITAIVGAAVAVGASAYVFVSDFPRGVVVFACVFAAFAAAWFGLLRHGARRLLGVLTAALLLGIAIGTMLSGDNALTLVLVAIGFAVSVGGARVAFRSERSLPRAAPPSHPVLFVNPRSGDGRAAKANLAQEAQNRGIETVMLGEGEDLERLVHEAVGRAPMAWRWPGAMARRRSWRRSPPSTIFPMPAFLRGPATTSPSTSALTVRTSSVRSTLSSTAASASSTSAKSTVASSSTTSRWASTPTL